jgi:hypothetical protein
VFRTDWDDLREEDELNHQAWEWAVRQEQVDAKAR